MTCWPLVTYLLAGSANLCIYILSPFGLSSATMKILFHSRKFTLTLLRIILSSNSAVLINIITGVSPPHFDFVVFYVLSMLRNFLTI
jgi:hypothetical protein